LFEGIHLSREKSKFWYVSLVDMLKTDKAYSSIICDMFQVAEHEHIMQVAYYRNHATLFIDNNIYEQLHGYWTVNDLYTLDKEYQDKIREGREDSWYSIAEARVQHKPVQITAYDDNKNPIIYTEKQMYGLTLPDVQR